MILTAQQIELGYLLLADISGFVPFVAQSETEHANEIIRELLEFIITRLSPAFTVAQIDGDSVFAYASQDGIAQGETLFELLESIYTAFKDQLLQVSRVRTCGCNACRNTKGLDLKFAVHYGEYIPHKFKSQFDLIGLAPLFIRKREWKEPVRERTDWRGYALFTQDCLTRLDLHPDDLHVAEIPGGSVRTFGLNLQARYESMLEARRIFVSHDEARFSFSMDFSASPPALWQWINDPDKRTQWYILKWTARQRPRGRNGSGAVNHCNHGIAGDALETILDWHPFEYYTSEIRVRPFNTRMQQTTTLKSISNNETHVELTIKPADDSAGWFTNIMCRWLASYEKYALRRLKGFIEGKN